MTSRQFVKDIFHAFAQQDYLKAVDQTPKYVSFLKAHTNGLPPKEAAEYEKWFRANYIFIHDFHSCFLAIYEVYFTGKGKIKYSVEEVARDMIAELIKFHYPGKQKMILDDRACRWFINRYAREFKKIIKTSRGYDRAEQGYGRMEDFSFVNAHQLVNAISPIVTLEKEHEFIPLQLDLNREDGESLDNNVSEEEDIPDYLVTSRNASINRRKNMKRRLGCSIVILIVILLMAYLSTASLNPLAVYATNNLLVKIFVLILAGLLILILAGLLISQFGQMLSKYMMRKSVEVGTGRSADSAICPSCGISVLLNNDTLGLPIVCHTCHVAWHDGPKCYRKGMPPSNAFLPSYPCPNCRPSTPSD